MLEEMNSFVKANTMDPGVNGAMTENGAISYATIGSCLLDQFGKAGSYRNRDIETVWGEQSALWAEDPSSALKFPFYLRMITRKVSNAGKVTAAVQRGAGCRDEAFKRLLWIAKYHPDDFYRNLWILPLVGSWKDLWVLLSFPDADYLEKEKFFRVIAGGIQNEAQRDLVKKYLPRIRSDKKCRTPWSVKTNELAKEFIKFVGWNPAEYRKFKASGTAHEFQRNICAGLYGSIKWNTIPGKALLNLITGEFLERHKLTNSYIRWVETQPEVKFNGYAFELGRRMHGWESLSRAMKMTIDKQFENLIKTASDGEGAIKGNVLCAIDTSGSMDSPVDKYGTTAYDVCVSLGIYFSELNKGAFHNVIASFDNTSALYTLKGSFTDKWDYIRRMTTAWGGTNFQSLIDLIVNTRKKHPEMPVDDYPKTLLVISDMQFNPTTNEKTNYETAMNKLRAVFPAEFVDEFKIVWWYCTNRETEDFPSTMDHAGTYMFSGFDGAVISFLLGGDDDTDENKERNNPTMEEIINKAFSQEIMLLIH